MRRTIGTPAERPSVRETRRRAALPSPPGGRARRKGVPGAGAWLAKWAGTMAIAIGWAFAIAVLLVPKEAAFKVAIVECGVIAACFFGFGVGWHLREGADEAAGQGERLRGGARVRAHRMTGRRAEGGAEAWKRN